MNNRYHAYHVNLPQKDTVADGTLGASTINPRPGRMMALAWGLLSRAALIISDRSAGLLHARIRSMLHSSDPSVKAASCCAGHLSFPQALPLRTVWRLILISCADRKAKA